MDLTVIIVNYNGGQLLLQTLASVLNSSFTGSYNVVVVDNNSSDDSIPQAQNAFPSVKYIVNSRNLGFASANNVGIKSFKANYYLLLNSDTKVEEHTLEILWKFLEENPSAGIVGPRLVYPDGKEQKTNRRFPTPKNAIFGRKSLITRLFPNNRFSKSYYVQPEDDHMPFKVDWISGACFMIRDQVISQIGLLDETYFMYWEDADWCFRAQKEGWQVFSHPNTTVIHFEGGSSKKVSQRLIKEFHKSIFYFYSKNYLRGQINIRYILAFVLLKFRARMVLLMNFFKAKNT